MTLVDRTNGPTVALPHRERRRRGRADGVRGLGRQPAARPAAVRAGPLPRPTRARGVDRRGPDRRRHDGAGRDARGDVAALQAPATADFRYHPADSQAGAAVDGRASCLGVLRLQLRATAADANVDDRLSHAGAAGLDRRDPPATVLADAGGHRRRRPTGHGGPACVRGHACAGLRLPALVVRR